MGYVCTVKDELSLGMSPIYDTVQQYDTYNTNPYHLSPPFVKFINF